MDINTQYFTRQWSIVTRHNLNSKTNMLLESYKGAKVLKSMTI